MTTQQAIYNRGSAVRYAIDHYNDPNPLFANMDTMGGGGDCTNFTSQCLLFGGYPMDYRATGQATEWWYRHIGTDQYDQRLDDWWSCTWSLAETQYQYLRANHGPAVNLLNNPQLARSLSYGDIIYYDWNGNGLFNHGAIITAFDSDHVPFVTYRTLAPLSPVLHGHWTLSFSRVARRIWAMHLKDSPDIHPGDPNWSSLTPCDQRRKG